MFSNEHRLLQHDAIFYDDESVFAPAAVSFVRQGIERDEVVMVNTGANPITALLRAVFSGEEQVTFAEGQLYTTPAAALDGYRRTMERGLASGATGFRAMGFIDFPNSKLPWQEWLRYEAAVNRVLRDFPFRTLCPYDTSTMPAERIDGIMRAHTGLVDADGRHENGDYIEPEKLVVADGLLTPPLQIQASSPRMMLEAGDDLMELRLEIYAATMFTSLSRLQIDDFVKAVGEAVANAHKHGVGPVQLRLWASDDTVVCTVTDGGQGVDDPLVGYARPRHPSEGLGLWAIRQLVDICDYEHGPDGFTVRLASFA